MRRQTKTDGLAVKYGLSKSFLVWCGRGMYGGVWVVMCLLFVLFCFFKRTRLSQRQRA